MAYYPRALTQAERAILDFLLAGSDESLGALRAQAETAQVIGNCSCGCPSFDVSVDHALPSANLPRQAVAATTRPGAMQSPLETTGLLVWLEGGYLSSVELWWIADHVPAEFPAPSAYGVPQVGRVTSPYAD